MTESAAWMTFTAVWGLLLLIAVVAELLFEDKPKRSAGMATNVLVALPFVVIFGLANLGRHVGVYVSSGTMLIAGTAITGLGMVGYIVSLVSLGRNWSLGASIKEGHQLITGGPYRIVRHPTYLSMMMIYLGSGLLISSFVAILLTPLVGFIYWIRAGKEEGLLREEFPEYEQYADHTRKLIPWLL
jgi:protein-S-isoprenylcysteine O-methyltransferase Ste14